MREPIIILGRIWQDVGKIPSRFWSMLTWLHHIISADLSAAHLYYHSPLLPISKSVLLTPYWGTKLGRRLKNIEPHCNVHETPLKWLCDMVHCNSGSSHWNMVNCDHTGKWLNRLWHSNCIKKTFPTPLHPSGLAAAVMWATLACLLSPTSPAICPLTSHQ